MLAHPGKRHIIITRADGAVYQALVLPGLPAHIELSDVARQSALGLVLMVMPYFCGNILLIGARVIFPILPKRVAQAVAVVFAPDDVKVQVVMQVTRGLSTAQCS